MSFVGRYVVELSGHPRPSRVRAPCTVGVLPGPTRVSASRMSVSKSQPLCVLVGDVMSCVLCARVRGRVSRSCATENTYTPSRLEALFKSQSSPFSSSCIVRSNISARVPKPFNLFDTFFLVVGSVAIHLGYLNANLFLSRKVDQLRMLSRLSLDFTATGNALYFHVIGVVSISIIDCKRCTILQSYSFSVISFVPFVPSVPLVPSRIHSKFSEVCACSFRFVILFEISSTFSCLLSAVSQSVLFTQR